MELGLEVLEGVERYISVGDRLRLIGSGGALWLTPLLPVGPTAAGCVGAGGDSACFHQRTAAVASDWAVDPLMLTLALFPPWGSARLDVRRHDDRPEQASTSVVSLEIGDLRDDAVSRYRRVAVLERRENGRWHVIATTVATRCWRGRDLWIGPPDRCR